MLVEGGWTLPAAGEERGVRDHWALTSGTQGEDSGLCNRPLPGTLSVNSGLGSSQDREPCFCPLVWPQPTLCLIGTRN